MGEGNLYGEGAGMRQLATIVKHDADKVRGKYPGWSDDEVIVELQRIILAQAQEIADLEACDCDCEGYDEGYSDGYDDAVAAMKADDDF